MKRVCVTHGTCRDDDADADAAALDDDDYGDDDDEDAGGGGWMSNGMGRASELDTQVICTPSKLMGKELAQITLSVAECVTAGHFYSPVPLNEWPRKDEPFVAKDRLSVMQLNFISSFALLNKWLTLISHPELNEI